MQALILTIHILACLFLIVVVLLQSGKEGMGVIFGGGSSSVFGSSGAGGLLTKVTAVVAAVFLITSLTYNIAIKSDNAPANGSVMDSAPAPAPVVPQGVEIEGDEGQDNAAASSEGGVTIEENAPAEGEQSN